MPQNRDRTSAPFRFSREFAAPCDSVFAALTQAEHLARWMSPAGMQHVAGSLDLRVNGTYHYGIQPPGGPIGWGLWTFREIQVPTKLVTVVQFSDERGGATRHPMAVDWPLYTLSSITLEDLGGKTRLTLDWRTLNASEAEERTFDSAHAGMAQGWGGTMDQLAQHLAQSQAI